MKIYNTIAEMKQANADAGHHWFEPESMRFFRTRIAPGIISGRYFVTSEQFVPYDGPAEPRRYSVRVIDERGHVDTVGEFQSYATLKQARAAARRAADNYELASRDASLGVGHIWTATQCPAYRNYEPNDCTCRNS